MKISNSDTRLALQASLRAVRINVPSDGGHAVPVTPVSRATPEMQADLAAISARAADAARLEAAAARATQPADNRSIHLPDVAALSPDDAKVVEGAVSSMVERGADTGMSVPGRNGTEATTSLPRYLTWIRAYLAQSGDA